MHDKYGNPLKAGDNILIRGTVCETQISAHRIDVLCEGGLAGDVILNVPPQSVISNQPIGVKECGPMPEIGIDDEIPGNWASTLTSHNALSPSDRRFLLALASVVAPNDTFPAQGAWRGKAIAKAEGLIDA